jgi:hypothetical protein
LVITPTSHLLFVQYTSCLHCPPLQLLQLEPTRERFRQDPNLIFNSSSSSKLGKPSWLLSAFPADQATMTPLVGSLGSVPSGYDAHMATVLAAWAGEMRKYDTCYNVYDKLPVGTALHSPLADGRAAFRCLRMRKGTKKQLLQAGDVVKLPLSGKGKLRVLGLPGEGYISGVVGYSSRQSRQSAHRLDDSHLSSAFYGKVRHILLDCACGDV